MDVNYTPAAHKTNKPTPIRIGTWNVRTMQTGLHDDIRDGIIRKTVLIDRELDRLQLDIVGLQETRLAGCASLKEKNFTFYWKGLDEDQPRLHGVGFAVRNTHIQAVTTPVGTSERLMSMSLNTEKGKVNLITAYAPTLQAPDEDKDRFYASLQEVIKSKHTDEPLYILGDFNARVGQENHLWPSCLGHHGIGKMNENGQRLLELCSNNGLCISNTYFAQKERQKVTWCHPRSKHWHQLDLILTRKKHLNSVKSTRAYHSADCNTDHTLVISKLKVKPKRMQRSKTGAKPKINAAATKDQVKRDAFAQDFNKRMSSLKKQNTPDETWNQLRDNIYASSKACFGLKRFSNTDWIEAHSDTLMPLIVKKRTALVEQKRTPSSQHATDSLRKAKSDLQRESRRCANEFWTDLSTAIQRASDSGDAKTKYNLMRKALGPTPTKVASLKTMRGEPIEDTKEQLERWVEHYSNLYSKDVPANPDLEEALPTFPEATELDQEPTEQELTDAINALATGKSPGEDNIPAEILKANQDVLQPHLYNLLIQSWRAMEFPHDMRNAKIVTLYKNKGDKGDCNNYRGISLLSITGKVFARIILKRLQTLAERILPESQCGFRAGRSTTDMIFTLRQLQEKCREQGQPLYIAFVDLTKAFDTVSRSSLYQVLKSIGCPPILLQLTKSFHEEMKSCVQYDGNTSDYFEIKCGVKQGCVLAPTLFGIYFAALLRWAFMDTADGIYIRTRLDGSLFNLQRLRSKKYTIEAMIRDLLFADDAALTAHREQDLQRIMNSLATACDLFSLTISIKKTEVLFQGIGESPSIILNGQPLNNVEKFVYLGSTITSSLSLDEELNSRIGKAATTFGKLIGRVWTNNKLTTKTKMLVYQACVLTTLLYGSETWTLYACQEKRLNSFHMRCLRRILGIKWQDKITNTEVLYRTEQTSLYPILRRRRLRWLGHVKRMDDTRIPKQILYGELLQGKRGTGRPKLRYKDTCKRTLKDLCINEDKWSETAEDRDKWRAHIYDGAKAYEKTRSENEEASRQRRKNPASGIQELLNCKFCKRLCRSKAGLSNHERHCSRKR